MSEYPFLKIHSCSSTVTNADYVDINYTAADFFNIPTITVTIDTNINAYTSSITKTTARINFSTKYTGTVKYTAISTK
tara:strand:- start:610 stop:843 length:234 start_codon:yes stop_codon:yes gene_type:complete